MEEFESFIDSISSQFREKIKEFSDATPIRESVMGFISAVNWKEPWIIGLLLFHFTLLTCTVITRKHSNLQIGIFLLSFLSVFMAEQLNSVASQHWKSFATQPYFDRNGVFTSTLWSGPFLIVATIVLVNLLLSVLDLMVKWKRAQLRHRARVASKKGE